MGPMLQTRVRWPLAIALLMVVAGLVFLGLSRLHLEADIFKALPGDDLVLDEARYVFGHHPALDRIAVDIALADGSTDPDALVDAAQLLRQEMEASTLFKQVGISAVSNALVQVLNDSIASLPVQFGPRELDQLLVGKLDDASLNDTVAGILALLSGLEGIGQAEMAVADPFRLREAVLARLGTLLPSGKARLYKGHLLSEDDRHLLLVAEPVESALDTARARELKIFFATAAESLNEGATQYSIAPVGAFRAALDNEEAARSDTQRAIILASIIIVLLLLLFFPRPWMGVLALLPALSGTAAGLVVYSLFESSISLLALGFGGAIVSITVDHGIAYLLFLDRPDGASGKAASHEVFAVALLAALTTVGAFLSLRWSGFPVLRQLGLFAAAGVGCSFLFVHTIFPAVIPTLGPAKRSSWVNSEKLTFRLTRGGWVAWTVAVCMALTLGFFARPEFRADLGAMNSVRPDTLAAEKLVTETWGDVLGKIAVLIEAENPEQLHHRADTLTDLIDSMLVEESLKSAYTPALLYPGPERAGRNFQAWQAFWTLEKRQKLRAGLSRSAAANGFTSEAFEPFLRQVEKPSPVAPDIQPELRSVLGISTDKESGRLLAICAVTPGPEYDARAFFDAATQLPGIRVMDPRLYADTMSMVLTSTFTRMLVVIGIGVVILLFLFFLDIVLALLVMVPLAFSMVCTLGVLHLLDRPLDIPSLLLAVVVVGMGIDYAIFFVRSHQRYRDEHNPSFGPIRSAVLLACLSTLAGFGTLALAEHVLLKSAGLTGLLAIGFAGIGAFVLLPPLLRLYFKSPREALFAGRPGTSGHRRTVMRRYRGIEAYPRQFARFKMLLDPMFPDLAKYVKDGQTVLDIGCGYGVPGAWLMSLHKDLRMYGLDPDAERVRVTRMVWGDRGRATVGAAPDLPSEPAALDVALMLDMAHHLSDEELHRTVADLARRMGDQGTLLMRVTVPTDKRFSWERWLEKIRFRMLGIGAPLFRTPAEITALMEAAGFGVRQVMATAKNREETWFVGEVGGKTTAWE